MANSQSEFVFSQRQNAPFSALSSAPDQAAQAAPCPAMHLARSEELGGGRGRSFWSVDGLCAPGRALFHHPLIRVFSFPLTHPTEGAVHSKQLRDRKKKETTLLSVLTHSGCHSALFCTAVG